MTGNKRDQKDWELRRIACEIIARLPTDVEDSVRIVDLVREMLLEPRRVPEFSAARRHLTLVSGD